MYKVSKVKSSKCGTTPKATKKKKTKKNKIHCSKKIMKEMYKEVSHRGGEKKTQTAHLLQLIFDRVYMYSLFYLS